MLKAQSDEFFDNYPRQLAELAVRIRNRNFSYDERHIILTPDRYTLHVEKALFKGSGAIDCEVLTLSRLTRRIIGGRKTLSREASVMLIARAISAVKEELTYYAQAARYPDFASSVYNALIQICSSCSSAAALADALSDGGAADVSRAKFRDLALIKREYDALKAGALDAPDRLEALRAGADCEFVRGAHFYAIGYNDATELMKSVFSSIKDYALSFEIFNPPEIHTVSRPMTVFRTPDAISQYKLISSSIRDYVFNGGRYGDVAVICPEPRALCRILNEYKIAYYADNSVPLSDTPPLRAITAIYKIKGDADGRKIIDADKLISLCKNPFCACDDGDADRLRDYLLSNGIRYVPLDSVIDDAPAARAFSRAKALVEAFCGDSFAAKCTCLMENCDFDGIAKALRKDVEGLSSDSDIFLTDMLSPIRDLIGLVNVCGTGDIAADASMFFSAARAVKVNSMPRYADRVTVCKPETLRLTKCKMLYVADFNEGTLPITIADSGLISDEEIRRTGGMVQPSAREKNRQARDELISVIMNAQNVFCTYQISHGAKKATALSAICKKERDYIAMCAVLKRTDNPGLVASLACVPSAAQEMAARDMTAYTGALSSAVTGGRAAKQFERYIGGIKHRSLSVSELTRWFYCPYARFLSYEIGLVERKTAELSAPDFGLIIHDFMENFVRDKLYLEPDVASSAQSLAAKIIEKTDIKLTPEESARLLRDARDYALLNTRIIRGGSFAPDAARVEHAFSGDIRLGKAGVAFRGKIDRIDEYAGEVRIIDYKTGAKNFSDDKCADGRDMQLPLYAAQLRATGEDVTGMFYIPMQRIYDAGGGLMQGRLVKDVALACAYDRSLLGGEPSEVIPVTLVDDGKKAPHIVGKPAMEREKFDGLITACLNRAHVAADEIDSGYIERSPVKGGCDHCQFSGLCEKKFTRAGKERNAEEE